MCSKFFVFFLNLIYKNFKSDLSVTYGVPNTQLSFNPHHLPARKGRIIFAILQMGKLKLSKVYLPVVPTTRNQFSHSHRRGRAESYSCTCVPLVTLISCSHFQSLVSSLFLSVFRRAPPSKCKYKPVPVKTKSKRVQFRPLASESAFVLGSSLGTEMHAQCPLRINVLQSCRVGGLMFYLRLSPG